MQNREKLSVSPWSIRAEGYFATRFAAVVVAAIMIGFALGQLSVIRACFGY